jgi:integrase
MSNKVIEILTVLSNANLDSTFCFPSARSKNRHITTNALLIAIRSAGIDKETFTTHGFRHMASTRLNELGFNRDVIESQLAHKLSGVRGVYNQAEYLDERKNMMQVWSDYLDNLLTE